MQEKEQAFGVDGDIYQPGYQQEKDMTLRLGEFLLLGLVKGPVIPLQARCKGCTGPRAMRPSWQPGPPPRPQG